MRESMTKVFRRAGCGKSARPVRRGGGEPRFTSVALRPTLLANNSCFGPPLNLSRTELATDGHGCTRIKTSRHLLDSAFKRGTGHSRICATFHDGTHRASPQTEKNHRLP